MTTFRARASDNIHWMEHVLRTDLRYQTESGRAFTGSDQWSVAANATDYIELRVPVGVTARIYTRLTAISGNNFEVDFCSVASITSGATQFAHTNMIVGGDDPQSRLWRGATNPVGLVVKERSFIPSSSTGNASGATEHEEAYRIIRGSSIPPILRVRNTQASAQTFSIIVLWTEEADQSI